MTLAMIASASIADPSVLAAGGAALSNVTAEGYPAARYHSGAVRFDQVENLAIERAKRLDPVTAAAVRTDVGKLCARYPLPVGAGR